MSITVTVTSQAPASVRADLLALPVAGSQPIGPGVDDLDRGLDGRLDAFIADAGFSGKPGETLLVPAEGLAAATVLLVGVGDADEVTAATLRRAAAAIARRASKVGTVATTLTAAAPEALDDAAAARAVAEGFMLGSYQFRAYKTKGEASKLKRAVLVGPSGRAVTDAIKQAQVVSDAVRWARDIVNEPSGSKSPTEFAAAAKKLLAGKGVRVTVLTESQIAAQKMGGVLGVGQGSSRPPRFVKAVYEPTRGTAKGTLALVGKGVVFDTGGISIKPAEGMETMKTDMGGAAAVLAAMSTLRDLGVRHRVIAYAPMVENMPSGSAIRPGDVLRMRDGQTVEVLNTDAEGRLILADALAWAVEDKADAIVDLATLTGACVVALGEKVAGLMSNDDDWAAQVRSAADRAGEPVWPLPLPADYKKQLESEVADLRNIGTTRYGGALTAAMFLQSFVDDVPWVHLDIAGPARASADDGELSRGGTGFGVRTLAELARTFEPPPARTKATSAKRTARKRASKRTTRTSSTAKRASRSA